MKVNIYIKPLQRMELRLKNGKFWIDKINTTIQLKVMSMVDLSTAGKSLVLLQYARYSVDQRVLWQRRSDTSSYFIPLNFLTKSQFMI